MTIEFLGFDKFLKILFLPVVLDFLPTHGFQDENETFTSPWKESFSA